MINLLKLKIKKLLEKSLNFSERDREVPTFARKETMQHDDNDFDHPPPEKQKNPHYEEYTTILRTIVIIHVVLITIFGGLYFLSFSPSYKKHVNSFLSIVIG